MFLNTCVRAFTVGALLPTCAFTLADDARHSTEVNGQKFVALILQDGDGELYLPDESQELNLGYSEGLSSQGDAQTFLTNYLNQK